MANNKLASTPYTDAETYDATENDDGLAFYTALLTHHSFTILRHYGDWDRSPLTRLRPKPGTPNR